MNKILTLVMFFAVFSIPMSLGLQEAFGGATTSPNFSPVGTVTINPTCGTTATGTIAYPALDVGSTTSNVNEQIISITNTGNRAVNIIVSGTDWTNTVSPLQKVMESTVTHFAIVDDIAYGSQSVMPETGVSTANVVIGSGPGIVTTVFHKVSIVLVTGQQAFQLTAQQTETFAFDCP